MEHIRPGRWDRCADGYWRTQRVDDDAPAVREESERAQAPRRRLRLVHRIAGQEVPFDLADESAGTRTWFQLIGPALGALRDGRVMLFDEIDASLHPKLSAHLLELFQDPATNPFGAQRVVPPGWKSCTTSPANAPTS